MYKNLKHELLYHGIRYADIAEVLNCSYNTVINKVNGRTAFTVDEAILLWEIFLDDIDFMWLFEKESEVK